MLKSESHNVREDFLNQKINDMRASQQKGEVEKQAEIDELFNENNCLTEKLDDKIMENRGMNQKIAQLTEELKGMVNISLLDECQSELGITAENLRLESLKSAKLQQKFDAVDVQYKDGQMTIKALQRSKIPNWESIQTRVRLSDVSEFAALCRGYDYADTLVTVLREVFKTRQTPGDTASDHRSGTGASKSKQAYSAGDSKDKKASAVSKQVFFVGLGLSMQVPLVCIQFSLL